MLCSTCDTHHDHYMIPAVREADHSTVQAYYFRIVSFELLVGLRSACETVSVALVVNTCGVLCRRKDTPLLPQ